MRVQLRFPFIAFSMLFLASTATSQCEIAKLTASAGATSSHFGRASAIADGTAFVGAPHDDLVTTDAGAVYVFSRVGLDWPESQVLTGSNSGAGDLFGSSLAVHSRTLAVGSPSANGSGSDQGAVYLFELIGQSWLETTIFTAPDAANSDMFGSSVAVHGDTLVIGSPNDDDNNSNSGSVYVYRLDDQFGWLLQDKLTHSTGASSDSFGTSVALDPAGDYLVVGSPMDDDLGTNTGSTVVYGRTQSGWIELSTQQASNPSSSDQFGKSVAFGSDYFLVGAPFEDTEGGNSGAVYVFHQVLGAWVEQDMVTARDATGNEQLGSSLAAADQSFVAGAPFDNHYGIAGGAAYEFQHVGGNWTFMAKLAPYDLQSSDQFGFSVAMYDETVLIGADQEDQVATNAGAAYIFAAPDFPIPYCFCDAAFAPCGNDDMLAGCTTFTGRGGLLTGCGLPSVAADAMTLTLSQAPSNQFGIMFMGSAQTNISFGNGRLCVFQSSSSPVYRYPAQSTGPNGTFTYGPGLAAFSVANFQAGGHFQPGDTWHFQTWFRDPLGPCGSSFNLSNGLSVTLQP